MQQEDKKMTTAGLIVIGKNWKYPNCPSTGEWKKYGTVINGILTDTCINTDKSINNTEMKRQIAI